MPGTAFVLIVTTALVAPTGTVSDAGMVAAATLLLDSMTATPPVGAGAFSVTVATLEPAPVTTLGAKVMEPSSGTTVAVAVLVDPP